MAKKGGLGKGLDSLISTKYTKEETKKAEISTKTVDKVDKSVESLTEESKMPTVIRLSLIDPNKEQPRKVFKEESLKELAESISRYGIIQPIVVTRSGKRYKIVAGERRFRAAKQAGLREVPVLIKEYTDAERAEIALIENIQRDDLNPMEKARAYERLINDYGLKQEELAARLSKSRAVITNAMRLLKLKPGVQELVENGTISEGHGRLLIGIEDPLQSEIARLIVKGNLSVRETERLIDSLAKKGKAPSERAIKAAKSADMAQLEDELQSIVNTKVSIKCDDAGKGTITIDYYSLDEFDRLIEILKKGSC